MTPADFAAELSASRIFTERIKNALAQYQAFWATEPGNMCCLHIALDDGNLEDEHVELCLNTAERNDHQECARMATVLLGLTEDERVVLEWLATAWEESLRDSLDALWVAKYHPKSV